MEIREDSVSKTFLRKMVCEEFHTSFGICDSHYIDWVTNSWFNDNLDRDGRWAFLEERLGKKKLLGGLRILDIASGCATFVLHGLKKGYNVWGVEPEEWKIEFLRMKIGEKEYPKDYLDRIVQGKGENLPFCNGAFDVVTTYQTLEHVNDVKECLSEMFRVVSGGGRLDIRSPNYNSFFEPHYRLPFLPQMNRKLAKIYLRLLGRPIHGIDSIKYVTRRKILTLLCLMKTSMDIEDLEEKRYREREEKIRHRFKIPKGFRWVARLLNFLYEVRNQVKMLGCRENEIILWISKSPILDPKPSQG